MGQQPNMEITLRDLPLAGLEPHAPGRWSPTRPGDLDAPEQVPWGGSYGRPAPDAGFARTLAADAELALSEGERQRDAEAAVAAVAAARASYFGRAPVKGDIAVAGVILGYDTTGVPTPAAERVAARRQRWVADLVRRPGNASSMLDAVPLDVLTGDLESARTAVIEGTVL
jgi:hypothetical protein